MSTRHVRSMIAVAAALAVGLLAARPIWAQSLADIAKKEEERRQKTGEPTKVYTNKDLKGGSEPAPPPPAADAPKDGDKAKTGDSAKDGKDGKDGKDAKDAKDADAAKNAKDPAYWSGKLKTLRDKLSQDEAYAEAMQTRINALTTDFVNRDDPVQRAKIEKDRNKALADLAQLTKSIDEDKKAISDFEELARRSGIPPGWLR